MKIGPRRDHRKDHVVLLDGELDEEGTAVVGLRLNPGVTLEQSTRIGREAERALAAVPEVTHVARRSGRAELDEHAEGVHVSELDVVLICRGGGGSASATCRRSPWRLLPGKAARRVSSS